MSVPISSGEPVTPKRADAVARPISGQFARFVIVGASNTALTLGCYALLLAAGLHYLAALVPAFLLGALNGYTLNRVWTFRAGPFHGEALARYVATQLTALGLNALALTTFVEVLGVTRLPAQLLAMPIVSCVTFAASRGWVFRRSVAVAGGSPSRSGTGQARHDIVPDAACDDRGRFSAKGFRAFLNRPSHPR